MEQYTMKEEATQRKGSKTTKNNFKVNILLNKNLITFAFP